MKSNPFKEIQEHQEPSKELKRRVLGDIDKIKLSMDLAELFLIHPQNVISTLFTTPKK